MEGASVEAVAAAIAALPKKGAAGRTVVITQGAKETVVAATGAETFTVPVTPIPAEKIVDVNGAGDAFVGGFLAALTAGKSVKTACEAGNWAAGVVIGSSGCSFDASLKCPFI
jgi:adenosine kinase